MADATGGLGQRLRQAREARGWTTRELAIRARIAASVINRLESGERASTSTETLRRLAQVLEVSADYLLELDEETPSACLPAGVALVDALSTPAV